jgi:hypothetical protein
LLAGVGIGMLWNAVIKIEHHEAIPKSTSRRSMWLWRLSSPRRACSDICLLWLSA